MKRALFVLGQLTDDDVEWLIAAGAKESVSAGNELICEGQPIGAVYVVLAGEFSVCAAAVDGREIARLGSGDIVGEMSFLDSRAPSATVAALRDSAVLAIPRDALASRLQEQTAFAARFYRALAMFLSSRLRGTVRRLGYGEELIEDAEQEDELDDNVLDTVNRAGHRFTLMLNRLMKR